MAYRLREGDSPALLLIHGSRCDSSDWEAVIPHLPDDLMLVTCDLQGHGESDDPTGDVTFDGLAEDVHALLEELRLDNLVVVGHSLGGMLGLRLGGMHLTRVAGLALVEGWTRLGVPFAKTGDMYGLLPADGVNRILARNAATEKRWPPGVHDAFWETVRRADAGEMLATTELPVLEIYGDRGNAPPTPASVGVPERQNIEMAWISHAGHYLLHEHPEEVGEALSSWLEIHFSGG